MNNLTSKHNHNRAQTHKDKVNDYERSEEQEMIDEQLKDLDLGWEESEVEVEFVPPPHPE